MKFRAELLFQQLDALTDLRKQAKQTMLRLARKHKDFKRLCKIPGLGFVSVSRLIAQVGTSNRFQTKRQFWKYCGLAVTTRSSADHLIARSKLQKRIKQTQTRGLSQYFCHRLKNVFKMAAQKSARCEPFGRYYENLLNSGTRPSLAQVSLARKIAAVALSVWKNQTDFDAQRLAASI